MSEKLITKHGREVDRDLFDQAGSMLTDVVDSSQPLTLRAVPGLRLAITYALQAERERCARLVDAYFVQAERVGDHEYAGNLDELFTLVERIRSGAQP